MTGDGWSNGDAHDPERPDAEVVASANDAPRLGERLASARRRAGIGPWARRHLVLLGGVTAGLALAAAGVAYLVTRPPPVDPVVHVVVAGFASGASVEIGEQGDLSVSADYQITTLDPGAVTSPLGIVGPGLMAPTSSIARVEAGTPGLGRLGASVSCADPAWWDATEADYRARVVRTDSYGRVTTYDAPLGGSPLGDVNHLWRVLIRQLCLFDVVQGLPPAAATGAVDARGDRIDVSVTVAHQSRQPPLAAAARSSTTGGCEGSSSGQPVLVPPGGAAELTTTIQASDCRNGVPSIPSDATPEAAASRRSPGACTSTRTTTRCPPMRRPRTRGSGSTRRPSRRSTDSSPGCAPAC